MPLALLPKSCESRRPQLPTFMFIVRGEAREAGSWAVVESEGCEYVGGGYPRAEDVALETFVELEDAEGERDAAFRGGRVLVRKV